MSDVSYDVKAIADMAVDALLASPIFANIPTAGGQVAVSLDQGDIENAITQDLNKIGLNITVTVNDGDVRSGNLPGPYFEPINLIAIITESTTVNRALATNGGNNPTAYQAFAAACAILHQLEVDGVQLFEVYHFARVLSAPPDQNVWNVFFRTQGGLSYARPTIAPVTATSTPNGDGTANVVLACATPGAPIWYTTDGSYPAPLGKTSQLYLPYAVGLAGENGQTLLTEGGEVIAADGGGTTVQPLVLAVGTNLIARAWLAGYGPANPAQLNQTI